MRPEKSEIKWRIMVASICMIFLVVQSYVYLTFKFDSFLTPFVDYPTTHSFVRDALLNVWSGMLVWPFILFMLILSEILAILRARRRH
jgi:hypothetical protein